MKNEKEFLLTLNSIFSKLIARKLIFLHKKSIVLMSDFKPKRIGIFGSIGTPINTVHVKGIRRLSPEIVSNNDVW